MTPQREDKWSRSRSPATVSKRPGKTEQTPLTGGGGAAGR